VRGVRCKEFTFSVIPSVHNNIIGSRLSVKKEFLKMVRKRLDGIGNVAYRFRARKVCVVGDLGHSYLGGMVKKVKGTTC